MKKLILISFLFTVTLSCMQKVQAKTEDGWVCTLVDTFNESGEKICITHTWNKKGTYTIKVKAKDINDAISEWTIIEISIPKSSEKQFYLFLKIWERFLILEKIFYYIRGIKI